MIDQTYGHLAPDAEQQERLLLDGYDERLNRDAEADWALNGHTPPAQMPGYPALMRSAGERTRTSKGFRPTGPKPAASSSSATPALFPGYVLARPVRLSGDAWNQRGGGYIRQR
jgi:hypothetical protein